MRFDYQQVRIGGDEEMGGAGEGAVNYSVVVGVAAELDG